MNKMMSCSISIRIYLVIVTVAVLGVPQMLHAASLMDQVVADSPLQPSILVNGSSGPLTVSPSTPLTVSIGLSPGSKAGQLADWWVVAYTSAGFYSYVYPGGWTPGIVTCVQASATAFSGFDVLNSTLPEGSYTFYFGLDFTPNRQLDVDTLIASSVQVTVSSSSTNFTGNYSGNWYSSGASSSSGGLSAQLTQSGTAIQGTVSVTGTSLGSLSGIILSGTINNGTATIQGNYTLYGLSLKLTLTNCTLSGNTLSGNYALSVNGIVDDSGSFTLTR